MHNKEEIEGIGTGYFVERYDSFEKLLCERGWTLEEYIERINDSSHRLIQNLPVIVYENPELSLFKVGYLEEDATPMKVLDTLKGTI
ncbi:hypothetical protein ACFOLA_03075 [Salinicoccus hispanicus]|uniref:Uncharacterized protein n=2 Tax=Salinicoccus hispanicus TaxID=157225 RepID=A0A6N8U310_9STAP|nr:hypothetical protein [Salinicoccus hispanicus]